MRALAVESVPASPEVREVDAPRPEAGEVLVQVASASVNGFDAATAAGYLLGAMEHRYPLVLGKDLAGTITELGEGVEGFAVGDQVFGVVMKPVLEVGSLAQYVTVPAAYGIARVPQGLPVQEAGALGLAGTTAADCVDAVGLAEGHTVLVSGATGGVGAFAVQLAASRGARVIATARPGAEADFVTGLAPKAEIVDHTGDLDAQVRELAPEGVDAVLHLAGDPAQLAGLLRAGGRLASTLGFGPEAVAGQSITAHSIMADPSAQTLTKLADLAASGALRVPVTAAWPLEQAHEAFGAGALGKLAVTCA